MDHRDGFRKKLTQASSVGAFKKQASKQKQSACVGVVSPRDGVIGMLIYIYIYLYLTTQRLGCDK